MRILLLLISLWALPALLFAKQTSDGYQIDVVLFQNPGLGEDSNEVPLTPAIPPNTRGSIPLRSKSECRSEYFCLLPLHASTLQQSWYALSRNDNYRLLTRYSWIQPNQNRRAVLLPERMQEDVKIEGNIRVQKGTYYYFNSNLSLYSSNSAVPIVLKQQIRLKEDQTVYLDHPHVGMLVRIHKSV